MFFLGDDGIEVVELFDTDFDSKVLSKDAGVWFVRFYAPVRPCSCILVNLYSGAVTARLWNWSGRTLPRT